MAWKRILQLAIGICFAALIGSNLLAGAFAYQYYVALNATRLDPLGLSSYPINSALAEKTAVFVGDSRAFQWTLPEHPTLTFLNRGIGGQTSAQVLQRYAAHVHPLQPEIVVIQVGINDLKTLRLFPNQQEQIIAQTEENILQLATVATSDGAQVVLTTIIPVRTVRPMRRPFWSPRTETAIDEINNRLRAVAKEEGYLLLDAADLLGGENGRLHPQFAVDELHLNERGYEQLNHTLLSLLEDK